MKKFLTFVVVLSFVITGSAFLTSKVSATDTGSVLGTTAENPASFPSTFGDIPLTTTNPTTSGTSSDNNTPDNESTGMTSPIVIACLVCGAILILFLIIFLLARRRREEEENRPTA